MTHKKIVFISGIIIVAFIVFFFWDAIKAMFADLKARFATPGNNPPPTDQGGTQTDQRLFNDVQPSDERSSYLAYLNGFFGNGLPEWVTTKETPLLKAWVTGLKNASGEFEYNGRVYMIESGLSL